jgi:hypothetical protein
VFALAVVVGFYVITNVHHALHTPLMSVTNAISGIIVIGALLGDLPQPLVTVLAVAGILVASINVFGRFTVTRRMLRCSGGRERCPPPGSSRSLHRRRAALRPQPGRPVQHETAKTGNTYGIVGMAVALVAIWVVFENRGYAVGVQIALVFLPMIVGGDRGVAGPARRMTGMPQLIAMLRSFVGLAAVLVGYNAWLLAEAWRPTPRATTRST